MTALATLKDGTIIAYAVKRDGEVCVANEAFSGGRVLKEPCHEPHVRSPRFSYFHSLLPEGGPQYKSRAEAIIAMFEAIAKKLEGARRFRKQAKQLRWPTEAQLQPNTQPSPLQVAQAAVSAMFGRKPKR